MAGTRHKPRRLERTVQDFTGLTVAGGRVLVVDDDPGLLEMVLEDLRKYGFDVVGARSDRAAYKALESAPAFDVLVVDIDLGLGTTGFDVARAARRRNPKARIIYMSGEANAQSWVAFGVPGSDYISKPFRLEKLNVLLRHDLDHGEKADQPD